MFHAPYGGHAPRMSKTLQYWGVFLKDEKKPVALFAKHDVAVMFKETMTDGQCEIRTYVFRPEQVEPNWVRARSTKGQ